MNSKAKTLNGTSSFIFLLTAFSVCVGCEDRPSADELQRKLDLYYSWEKSEGRFRKSIRIIEEWYDKDAKGKYFAEVQYERNSKGDIGIDRWMFARHQNRWKGRPLLRRFDEDWFDPAHRQTLRDRMVNDLNNLGALSFAHKLNWGSYLGFKIPHRIENDIEVVYELGELRSDNLTISALSVERRYNYVTVNVDGNGKLHDWKFFGEFQ